MYTCQKSLRSEKCIVLSKQLTIQLWYTYYATSCVHDKSSKKNISFSASFLWLYINNDISRGIVTRVEIKIQRASNREKSRESEEKTWRYQLWSHRCSRETKQRIGRILKGYNGGGMCDCHFRIFSWKRATKSWQIRSLLVHFFFFFSELTRYSRNEISPGAISHMRETPLCEKKRVGTADDTESVQWSFTKVYAVRASRKIKERNRQHVYCARFT